jgi:hypothetical protein
MSKRKRIKMQGIKPLSVAGMSPSRFKSFLKCIGHKVPRDFYYEGCVSLYKNRYYRWRFWGCPYTGDDTFVVDISCVKSKFDRWANSVEKTVPFESWDLERTRGGKE